MDSHRQIAVIAPERMLSAFSVLIESAPNQSLLASSSSINELRTNLGENKPDVILVYLVHESGMGNEKSAYEIISRIKNTWPDALCISILKYPSQLEKAKEIGSDFALVDGVSAERLLAAIEGKSMWAMDRQTTRHADLMPISTGHLPAAAVVRTSVPCPIAKLVSRMKVYQTNSLKPNWENDPLWRHNLT